MRDGRRIIAALIMAGGALLWAPSASAQGNGNGQAKGLSKGRGPMPAAAATSDGAAVPLYGIRQFGSWLDDASLAEPGGGWAAVSLGFVRSAGGRQMDFPIADVGVGLMPRVQVGMTLPYYRLTFTDGSQAAGLGDVYLNAKIGIFDPAKTEHGLGLAVTPLVEILSSSDLEGGRDFHVALPVSVEWRQPKYRVYGSSGWFSRGAFFGSGAVEVPLSERVIVTGVLSHTRALNDDPNADALGLSKARTDLTGGAAFIATSSIAFYGSIGRTISAQDANAASIMLSGGVSVSFARTPTGRH
ncbi:MAG: hypothetical protein ACRD2A_04525 [Vicinamibacterales bacterium]